MLLYQGSPGSMEVPFTAFLQLLCDTVDMAMAGCSGCALHRSGTPSLDYNVMTLESCPMVALRPKPLSLVSGSSDQF